MEPCPSPSRRRSVNQLGDFAWPPLLSAQAHSQSHSCANDPGKFPRPPHRTMWSHREMRLPDESLRCLPTTTRTLTGWTAAASTFTTDRRVIQPHQEEPLTPVSVWQSAPDLAPRLLFYVQTQLGATFTCFFVASELNQPCQNQCQISKGLIDLQPFRSDLKSTSLGQEQKLALSRGWSGAQPVKQIHTWPGHIPHPTPQKKPTNHEKPRHDSAPDHTNDRNTYQGELSRWSQWHGTFLKRNYQHDQRIQEV